MGLNVNREKNAVELLASIFHNPSIIKVGWSFDHGDVKMLRSSMKGHYKEAFNPDKICGILDLNSMLSSGLHVSISTAGDSAKAGAAGAAGGDSAKAAAGGDDGSSKAAVIDSETLSDLEREDVDDDISGDSTSLPQSQSVFQRQMSLSNACQLFLGKPLHKSSRLSDWNARPLSADQICYAALDAHVLLALTDLVLENNMSLKLDCVGEMEVLQVVQVV